VFKPGYPLLSLDEVDAFILQHGHLSGIPAGAEVESEGLKLGEMQALMMAKIEELTLHLIEQEKRIDALEAENAELKSQLLK